MPDAIHVIGDSFHVQFAWKLPDGDYLRAVFRAEVQAFDRKTDRYIVRLAELVAGRQETAVGEMRSPAEMSRDYWALVGRIVGRRIALAYEAADGRALHLRLATLTGEHNYFARFDDAVRFFEERRPSSDS